MDKRYVIDTTSLISYFKEIFNVKSQISQNALKIIDEGFSSSSKILLVIPSVVIIEIYKKFFKDNETSAKIRFEVFERIYAQPNIEIKPLEKEVLENFIKIRNIESRYNFDNHDKQILASAMMLQCPLITSDRRIIRYNHRNKSIPEVIF